MTLPHFVPSKRLRKLLPVLLWLGISLGYTLLRSSTVLVWDDSPKLAANLFDTQQPLVWSGSETIKTSISRAFAEVTASGYRPLSRVINLLGIATFSVSHAAGVPWFFAVGAVIGFSAVCALYVARRFLRSDAAAYGAVFLLVFSAPFITGSWIVFAGIQALVPLIICGGLLIYWRTGDQVRHRSLYIVSLSLVLLFGPWVREFIGILALLVIFLEFQRNRRATLLMAMAALCFIHSLYPTALVKWVAFSDLPLQPVFMMGSLGDQVGGAARSGHSVITQLWNSIRWEVPVHFLSLFPPLLLLTTVISLSLPSILTITRVFRCNTGVREIKENYQDPRTIVSAAFVIGSLISLFIYFSGISEHAVWIWFCAGIAFLAFKRHVFLSFWYLLSLVPFLWVFTEQVHLAYSLLPASIGMVAALEDLWSYVRRLSIVLRWGFMGVLLLVTGDHALNLYGSYKVVTAVNDGILRMAAWFVSNVPRGSLVVTNALHPEDIRLFSGDHMTIFWTVRAGIPHPSRAVDERDKLEALLKDNQGKRASYFLDVRFNFTPDKRQYHSHKYVRDQNVVTEELGLVHTTRTYYPYLDPLKRFVPRPYISFLGAPDLENDFYRGPAQNGTEFFREVYAEYHVYGVRGMVLKSGSVSLDR